MKNIENDEILTEESPFSESNEAPSGKQASGSKTGIAALLAGLALVFGKLKFLLVFLKFGKFFGTALSMLVTIGLYASSFGWLYGIGFVLLIFIHEMGHYLTAKNIGLNVSAPVFIPFVGAFIAMKDQPVNAADEAKVGLGGPVLGSLAALFCLLVGLEFKNSFFLALAYSGFLINIFNLIPVSPLDGGRIVSAISPKLWLIGIPVLAVAAFYFFNPIIILLLILGVYQAFQQWKATDKSYYDTPADTRMLFALLYFGLLLSLGVGMAYIHSINSFI